ncbi:NAD-dependent epimerase/dehydratase family protein [Azohydromonas lata]|uniref:NAD(P)-dependent oxidoreductase n=1 Tax=Azohydromonas lata TaxID=45677 RepID=A0ABU5IF19_9BURK|nr:NAD(P)-dependent oxidoreductase [Azohydromonas lata]MDZ5456528.1 NAD(P)-dependent oxidoreductase [Azohydromonas lata]
MEMKTPRTALVTGGLGFLGQAVAHSLRRDGYRVVGLGHGQRPAEEIRAAGFDRWVCGDVSLQLLSTLEESFELVVHCASNSAVGYSLAHPHEAFLRTVQSTADLLEHLRSTQSRALVIYPSSAAVYGAAQDRPLQESDVPNPVSPYGVHKLITEELLAGHARHFSVRVAIVRFFSIYGAGLSKQLLWDAAVKMSSGQKTVEFWGTGEETRDWIHVQDAADLIARLACSDADFFLLNGAAGERVTVRDVLEKLRAALGLDIDIRFNSMVRPGDPRFYHADVSRLKTLPWQPRVTLEQGLENYANWFKASWSK